MNLANGVTAVKDKYEDEWSFKFVGHGLLNALNDAYMDRVGGGDSGASGGSRGSVNCFYRVSIPYASETKNAMFKDMESAFDYVNSYILRNS